MVEYQESKNDQDTKDEMDEHLGYEKHSSEGEVKLPCPSFSYNQQSFYRTASVYQILYLSFSIASLCEITLEYFLKQLYRLIHAAQKLLTIK
jgi:hypothetical protein